MSDDDIIDGILASEGGFVDRPSDHGGPTNFGITMPTLASYRKAAVTEDDIRALTRDEAFHIYQERFLMDSCVHLLASDPLRLVVLDSCVLHGVGGGIRLLQRACHVTEDGVLGPGTLAAAQALDPRRLAVLVLAERASNEGAIVSHDPELTIAVADGHKKLQALNAFGWANRVAALLKAVA